MRPTARSRARSPRCRPKACARSFRPPPSPAHESRRHWRRELAACVCGDARSCADAFEAAHIATERFGHDDRAVALLVILEDRDQRSADREPGTVQRMDEARVLLALRAVPR